MSTIDIQGQYLVHAGDSLSFIGETAFEFIARSSGKPSELAIRGAVDVDFSAAAAGSWYGVYGDSGQGPARLDIAQGGLLSVTGTAATGGQTLAFVLAADGSRAANRGEISVDSETLAGGGLIHGEGSRLANAGSIDVSGETAVGFYATGVGAILSNHATITATGSAHATGLALLGHAEVRNDGDLIVTAGNDAIAVYADNGASIRNSGTIQAVATDPGPDGGSGGVFYGQWSGADRLVNSGLISADTAIRTSVSDLTLINSGEIDGLVSLSLGTDLIRNTGVMDGDIDLGVGDDRYLGAHGSHLGQIVGGRGADQIIGGADADLFYGDGLTADVSDGADLLKGGHGDDSLHGGGGADTLWGGAGADDLHGDGGADVFVYAKAADSAAGHADFIADLEAGDQIDLAAIDADTTTDGDQAFTVVSALDGHAGQAALSYDADADVTTLSLDIDGDGSADTVIHIAGDQTGFGGLVL